MKAPLLQTITVPAATAAAPSIINVSAAGDYFYCQTATTPFQIQFDAGAVTTCRSGQQLPGSFKRLTFFNSGAIPITIAYYISDEPISYVSDNQQKVGSSYSLGRGFINLGAGAGQSFSGSNNGTQRKQIVVHNLDANLDIWIRDQAGSVFDVVRAGQDWTFESDAFFEVFNNNGAAVNVTVGETFYQT